VPQVLAIWLDGFDIHLAKEWQLPALGRLRTTSAHAQLNNGTAHLTGLSGEHLATGLDPKDAQRSGAVHFDPATYLCTQQGASHPTAFGGVPSVVFDPCYFQLASAPSTVQGIVDWGAHDPGGPAEERPSGLHGEVQERFGSYPAKKWIYATPWASPSSCSQMGADLSEAVRARGQIARWLLGERLPEWQLAFIGVSEAHSASEGLFHGADPAHPMNALPSGPAAAKAIRDVYTEIDSLVSGLMDAFPDAIHVVFSMHGMGMNSSDVPSMVLLGELMRRWSGDSTPDVHWPVSPAGIPLLDEGQSWSSAVRRALSPNSGRGIGRQLPAGMKSKLAPFRRRLSPSKKTTRGASEPSPLDWMPLMRHAEQWSSMRAFALPSFYDGRVRANLSGREAHGLVEPNDYSHLLDELEALLRECRDPITGALAVADVHRPLSDPLNAGPTDADLLVTWNGFTLGLTHPELGTIGPFPPRRTGGHTSPWGACFISGPGIDPADLGTRSSFDVIPTIFDLLGSPAPWQLSGEPLELAVSRPGAP
jgi:hypothetical protein